MNINLYKNKCAGYGVIFCFGLPLLFAYIFLFAIFLIIFHFYLKKKIEKFQKKEINQIANSLPEFPPQISPQNSISFQE